MPTDLDACLVLAEDRGWAPDAAKWLLLFEVGEGLGLVEENGQLIGSVIVTRYPPGVAVIGMLLIASRFGRRGLGQHLMETAILRAKTPCVALCATPQGRPLYERLAFVVVEEIVKHTGVLKEKRSRCERIALRPLSEATWEQVAALDRVAFGADRTEVLNALIRRGSIVVAHDGARVVGYAGAWDNHDTLTIGPVVAAGENIAEALVAHLAQSTHGNIRIDIPARQAGFAAWARARGLHASAPDPLMSLHARSLPGDRRHLYGLVMQALG